MMLNKIIDALNGRKEIAAWTVRHVTTDGVQVYAVPKQIESQRTVNSENYEIDVLCNTTAADGSPTVGSGDVTILPDDDIGAAIDKAALVASLVSNPPHSIPKPAPFPDISLTDEEFKKDPLPAMNDLMENLRATASKFQAVRMTGAECSGEIRNTHLVNSNGIDAKQEDTRIAMEFVLKAQKDERESESFFELTRRRIADLDPEEEIQRRASHSLDLLKAEAPASRQGAVILRNDALATFVSGASLTQGVIQNLASAASKYAKISSWEIGKSVFTGEVKGDALTVWANRCIPYGVTSNRFDREGVPAQRIELIRENILLAFSASQRYAEYLDIPVTGAFGGVELPPGHISAADLLSDPHIEIIQFSWFNPDPITGDFASEIRFGYLVENGERKPFKGGQLIGNYMQALADVRWSTETGFFGDYLGPITARFNDLKLSGEDA